ncbi:MoaD/ThiS family protein [bacterium]|nr:MoaD/ThiS family protein [bacterium]
MIIKVNFYAKLRVTTGLSSVELEPAYPVNMTQLIDLVCEKTTERLRKDLLDGNTIRKGTLLLVDGRNILFLDGLSTVIHENQEVAFFPPGGGG